MKNDELLGLLLEAREADGFNGRVWDELIYGPIDRKISRELERRCLDVLESEAQNPSLGDLRSRLNCPTPTPPVKPPRKPWPLGMNPDGDARAAKRGLGHWSCVSKWIDSTWHRQDGEELRMHGGSRPWFEELKRFDERKPMKENADAFEPVDAEKPVRSQENKMGFTAPEQRVHDLLMDAYQAFVDLDSDHPDELRDFTDALHRLQDLLGVRVCRRSYPEGWPTYRKR